MFFAHYINTTILMILVRPLIWHLSRFFSVFLLLFQAFLWRWVQSSFSYSTLTFKASAKIQIFIYHFFQTFKSGKQFSRFPWYRTPTFYITKYFSQFLAGKCPAVVSQEDHILMLSLLSHSEDSVHSIFLCQILDKILNLSIEITLQSTTADKFE